MEELKITTEQLFIDAFKQMSEQVHKNAVEKGFWDVQSGDDWIDKNYHGLDLGYDCSAKHHKYSYEEMIKSYDNGQKNPEPNKGEKICLMQSELSEMLEGVRKPGPDTHCPEFTNEEIELADNFIRGMDYAEKFGLRLPEAMLAKMEFNSGRPYKHGKEF